MSIADRPADDLSVIARFMGYLLVSDTHSWRGEPCMFWQGGKSRGGDRWSEFAFYGTFNPGGCVKGGIRAHVFAAWLAGLIETLRVPEDMNLDHRCHQSLCCNPLHLEVVPKLVNQMRKRNRKEPPVTEDERDNMPMVRDPALAITCPAEIAYPDVPHNPDRCLFCEPVPNHTGNWLTNSSFEPGWPDPSPRPVYGKSLMQSYIDMLDTLTLADTIVMDMETTSLEPVHLHFDMASGKDRTAVVLIAHHHPSGSAAHTLARMGGSIVNGDTIYVPLEMATDDPKLESVAKLLEDASVELFGGPRRSASYKLEAEHREMLEMRNLPVEMLDAKPRRQFDNSAPRSPKQTRSAQRRGKRR